MEKGRGLLGQPTLGKLGACMNSNKIKKIASKKNGHAETNKTTSK